MIKKGLKTIAFIFGLFITLTIGVIIVVKSMINPNDYINELERSLSTQNVDITIEEDISGLLYPCQFQFLGPFQEVARGSCIPDIAC